MGSTDSRISNATEYTLTVLQTQDFLYIKSQTKKTDISFKISAKQEADVDAQGKAKAKTTKEGTATLGLNWVENY